MIKILIIKMTLTPKTKYKSMFDKSFEDNVKLYYIHWSKKNIISYIKNNKINGIILTGSTYRILHKNKKKANLPIKILNLNIPILGICYGYQWLIKNLCGKECLSTFSNNKNNRRFITKIIKQPFKVEKKVYLLNHHDYIVKIPKGWKIGIKLGKQILMAYNKNKKIIGLQIHPEAVPKTRKKFFKKWIKYITKK